jgi:hypothetical protein
MKKLLLTGVIVATLAPIVGTTNAAAAGNQGNAALCTQDLSSLFRSSDGSSFSNPGDCVSFGARGGTYTQLKLVTCVGLPGGICWSATGLGLEPGTVVTLNLAFNDGGLAQSTALVLADGTIGPIEASASCTGGSTESFSVSATGTTSAGAAVTTSTLTGTFACSP